MYKSTFKHTTGKSCSLPRVPKELQGVCLICNKKFKAYKETKFNTDYCNLHWDKSKNKRKQKKIKLEDKLFCSNNFIRINENVVKRTKQSKNRKLL